MDARRNIDADVLVTVLFDLFIALDRRDHVQCGELHKTLKCRMYT